VTKKLIKVILINITLIVMILGVFELYFWRVETSKLTARTSNSSTGPTAIPANRIVGQKYHTTPDDILGYALVKNSKRTVTRYVNDEILYNVTYTINKNGLRISPNTKKSDAPAVLFFGCSFTYGENVNDDETLPYVTGILTGREYATYNFGIHGHGPQHMLAEIQHGIVDSAITHKPRFAIYQGIPDHINRLKALEPWLIRGPHYILDGNGKVISTSVPLWPRIKEKLGKSYLYRTITRRIIRIKRDDNEHKNTPNWTENDDIINYAGVVEKAKDLLSSKYSGIEFHVIYWDDKNDYGFSKAVIEALIKKGIETHRLSSIIKGSYKYDNKNPYLIPYDGHPTPLTHKIIANYVVNEIIEKKHK